MRQPLSTVTRILSGSLARRPIRFLLVGAINTGFGFLAYSAALLAGASVALALGLSVIAGIGFNFLTTGTLVFRTSSLRSFLPFVLAYGAIYLVNLGTLAVIRHWLASPFLSQLIATAPVAVFSYWLLSSFVFSDARRPTHSIQPGDPTKGA
jgi:putative flippase GtrA